MKLANRVELLYSQILPEGTPLPFEVISVKREGKTLVANVLLFDGQDGIVNFEESPLLKVWWSSLGGSRDGAISYENDEWIRVEEEIA
jgi:hypothetical protein